ncbi:MAG: dihydroneopterin aldolase [Prevotella sp.]
MTISTGYIYLKDLRFHAYHGVLPQETVIGNDYTLDIRLKCPVMQAACSDNVEDTVNYASVYRCAAEEMAVPSKLLENVGARIAKRIFKDFPAVSAIELSLTKLNPPIGADCKGAGVELHLINDKTAK